MSDRSLSVRCRIMVLAGVLALPTIVGCETPPPRPPGPGTAAGTTPFAATPMERVLDTLQTQDSNWETLQARCTITFHHPRLTPNIGGKLNPMRFKDGAIYIDKGPTRRLRDADPKRRTQGYLVRLDFGAGNVIVSNGQMYMGRIRELGVLFQGVHGGKPHAIVGRGSRVVKEIDMPLSADDIVFAMEPFAALRGLPLIMKQTTSKLEVMALGMIATSPAAGPGREGSSKLVLKRGVEMGSEDKMTRWVYRYNKNGYPWSFILVRKREEVVGALKAPVQIPSRIWMHYPQTGTVVDIELSGIRLGVVIDPSRFELTGTVHTDEGP